MSRSRRKVGGIFSPVTVITVVSLAALLLFNSAPSSAVKMRAWRSYVGVEDADFLKSIRPTASPIKPGGGGREKAAWLKGRYGDDEVYQYGNQRGGAIKIFGPRMVWKDTIETEWSQAQAGVEEISPFSEGSKEEPLKLKEYLGPVTTLLRQHLLSYLQFKSKATPRGWEKMLSIEEKRPDGFPSVAVMFAGQFELIITAHYNDTSKEFFIVPDSEISTDNLIEILGNVEAALRENFMARWNLFTSQQRADIRRMGKPYTVAFRKILVCAAVYEALEPRKPGLARTEMWNTYLVRMVLGKLGEIVLEQKADNPRMKDTYTITKSSQWVPLGVEGSLPINLATARHVGSDVDQDSVSALDRYNVEPGSLASLAYTCDQNEILAGVGVSDVCVIVKETSPAHITRMSNYDRIHLQCLAKYPAGSIAIYNQMVHVTGNNRKVTGYDTRIHVRHCKRTGWAPAIDLTNKKQNAAGIRQLCQRKRSETPTSRMFGI